MVDLTDAIGYTLPEGKETAVLLAEKAPAVHLLEVDGTSGGYVMSLEGGWGIADVIEEPSATRVKKRPGPPHWEELELRLPLPVAGPVFDRIAGRLEAGGPGKEFLAMTVDGEGKVLRRRASTMRPSTCWTTTPASAASVLRRPSLRCSTPGLALHVRRWINE